MTPLAALLALGCVVDPRDVLDDADLVLEVEGFAPETVTLAAEVHDAADRPVSRAPDPSGARVEVYFFDLAAGEADWRVRSLDDEGAQLACADGSVRIDGGRPVRVPVDLGEGDTCCPEGRVDCDGECVDLGSDPDHCGVCFAVCADGEACAEGSCQPDCPAKLEECGGACVDLGSNQDHCGGCDVACSAGTACCGGSCADVLTDPARCGACDTVCPAGASCDEGSCACPDGLTDCGDVCTDPETDPANCGACGTSCERCAEGNCVESCPGGTLDCDGACIVVDNDPRHCGACDNACALAERCLGGECVG
jgi:hypothetical protein